MKARHAVFCCIILALLFKIGKEIELINKSVLRIYLVKSMGNRNDHVRKQCFRLSVNARGVGELRRITSPLDIGSTSIQDTKLVDSGILWKRNKTDSIMSCSQFVTLPQYMGRMGNQMFETASVIGLAYKYDAIPVIPSWLPLRKYFELPNIVDTRKDKLENIVNCRIEKSAEYYNCSKEFSAHSNISVHGFRQSWKYFEDIGEIIRMVFTFKSRHVLNAKRFLSSVSIQGYQRVCIHVRRGDNTLKTMNQSGHLTADRGYIERAQNVFFNKYEKVQFFVVSDDKGWCKKNLKNVTISSLSDPGDEMALMMLSDHVIVTVGSYGWWGAWLSGGTVVYLKTFARPGSPFESRFVMEDYIPSTWIGIN